MSKLMYDKKERGGIITCESGRRYIILKTADDQVCVISEGLMKEGVRFDRNSPDYKTSELKQIMETEILPMVEEDFGVENIIEHEVDLATVDMQKDFGSCLCKVRPVTFDEAREFTDLLENRELPDWYWTCTPWSTDARGWKWSKDVVSPAGCIRDSNWHNDGGVRPFCILKSNIFES